MRKNIVFLLIFTIVINTSFIYADNNDSIVVPNQVYTDLRNDFDYDSATDTYYFPVNNGDKLPNENTKSATVAVSGAVISSVLALAVKAGIEFTTSNSMSEFVSRFFMLEGIGNVVGNISSVIKNSINGTLDFSRSLLDTIGSKFAEVMSKGDVYSTYVKGRKILTISNETTGNIDSVLSRYIFENSTLPRASFYGEEIAEVGKSYYYDTDIWLPIGDFGTFVVRPYARNSSPYVDRVYTGYRTEDGTYNNMYSQYNYVDFPSDAFEKGMRFYSVPFFLEKSKEYYIGFVVAQYSTVTGYLADIRGTITYGSFPKAHAGNSSVLPVIGDSWSSGSIPGKDDSYDTELNVGIPKDTNELLNKKPSDVVSNPSYEVWTPGVTIIPPSIDTGTTDKPTDDIYPPIVDNPGDSGTDNPGDSGTDTPGDSTPSISWDWLKNLLDLIKNLIQTIVDWLTSFWDTLLEFLKSLLIPKANYWIDTLSDILTSVKNKIPDIDIDLLEELAVNEKPFEDIYARFFGIECLVVRGSVVNEVISWIKPIIQGLMALFLLLYNYNQVYKLIRGGSLVGSTCVNDERGK